MCVRMESLICFFVYFLALVQPAECQDIVSSWSFWFGMVFLFFLLLIFSGMLIRHQYLKRARIAQRTNVIRLSATTTSNKASYPPPPAYNQPPPPGTYGGFSQPPSYSHPAYPPPPQPAQPVDPFAQAANASK